MITLYKNAKILTKVSGAAQVVDGEIAIDNDKIAYIGAQFTEKADIIKDAHGNLVIPGFKNAHAHSAMTFLRSYAEDLPLKEWLFDKVFPLENKLTADDVYSLSKLAIAEYVRNGITSAFDMYFFPESIAKAYVDTGFRGVLCGAISAFDDSAATIDFELNKLETNYNKFNAYNPLVSYQLGFHAE
jgi:5-methylthioadenosine/S-adenosylhomocysteine deaminase